MSYDHITRDLCRKAADEIQASIKRTGALLPDPSDQMMVAIYASGTALGAAAGYASAMIERDTGEKPVPEEVLISLWQIMRPIALKAAGGDNAPYLELLEAVSAGNGEKHGG